MAGVFSFTILSGTGVLNTLPFCVSDGISDNKLVAYAYMSSTVGNDKVPSKGTAEDLRKLDPDDIAALSCYNSSDFDIVTSIKDQGDLPWCWAYGVTSAAETNILRKGILNRYINGKEFNINTYNTVYHVYNDAYSKTNKYSYDPLDNNPVVNVYDVELMKGNAQAPVLELLSQWKGAVNDATNDGTEYAYNNQAANLRNAYRLNKNVDVIKKAIATYGGVSIPYDTAFNDGYVYVNGTVDHLVELVGWDDSITPDQFPLTRKPTSNGAFIGKNSWG
jgi:C1A family cysteine protease